MDYIGNDVNFKNGNWEYYEMMKWEHFMNKIYISKTSGDIHRMPKMNIYCKHLCSACFSWGVDKIYDSGRSTGSSTKKTID